MFPQYEAEFIYEVFVGNDGEQEKTIDALMEMSS